MSEGQDVHEGFIRDARRTWRLADGRGGTARGTAAGAATRRTQVLLAAPTEAGPKALLARFDDRLLSGPVAHELTGAFSIQRDGLTLARPGAQLHLEAFQCEPFPRWRWRFDNDTLLERTYRMVHDHHALVATWRLLAGGSTRLSVAPLLLARHPDQLQLEDASFRGAAHGIPGRVRFETLPGIGGVTLWHNGSFTPARTWVRGTAYPFDEDDDGSPGAVFAPQGEDLFVPGWVQASLAQPGAALHLVVSCEEHLFRALATEERLGTPPARTLGDCVAALDSGAYQRREDWRKRTLLGADFTARQAAAAHGGAGGTLARRSEALLDASDPLTTPLALALLDGLAKRPGRATLLTGDGEERGASTLRAAGTLVTLRAFESARGVAEGYFEYLDEGLAPERFDAGDGLPRYGDPEASLWLVHLVDLMVRRGGEEPGAKAFLHKTAWPAIEQIMHHLRSGSRHGVHCDGEGLLWCGVGASASARADINALWYHALVAAAQLGKMAGHREHAAFYLAWAHELQRRFTEVFWDEACSALFVSLNGSGVVRGVSPSHLWAVALAPALLNLEQGQRLLGTLDRELFTPQGLRLAPGEEQVHAEWLGPWAAATLRAHGRNATSLARVHAMFQSLLARDSGAALAVNLPSREPVLAVAELLRAWIEDAERVAGVPLAL
ncbi:MAG: glycogen debranching enzyme N-terminal domain-containing protein [Candidatus Eisenbacteria bacterium]